MNIHQLSLKQNSRHEIASIMFINSMKIKRFVCLIFVLGVYLICADITFAQSAPQDDTQSWNEVQFTLPVNKKVDLILNGQLRFGRDLREFVDERAGVSVAFKMNKYFTFTPGYTYIAMQQPVTRRKSYENRLNFAATVRFPPMEKFTISDRNLVERRVRNSTANSTRYRNRLQIERPFTIGGVGLRFFISDEVFYDGAAKAWTRNRFSVGGSRAFNKRLTGDVYYLRQNDGRSRPGDIHVIGTTLRVRL